MSSVRIIFEITADHPWYRAISDGVDRSDDFSVSVTVDGVAQSFALHSALRHENPKGITVEGSPRSQPCPVMSIYFEKGEYGHDN